MEVTFSKHISHQEEVCVGIADGDYVCIDAFIDTEDQTRILVHHTNINAFVRMLQGAKRAIEKGEDV